MKYVYPAIFSKEDDQFLVSVPDLKGCHTFGNTLVDAFEMATDAICMWLQLAEDNNEVIPEPSTPETFINCDGFLSLIIADTTEYRNKCNSNSPLYMDVKIYPAIFEPQEKGYTVQFYDIPDCITEGDTIEEATMMAQDALGGVLVVKEEEKQDISAASNPKNISTDNDDFVVPFSILFIVDFFIPVGSLVFAMIHIYLIRLALKVYA